jgi:hypothetical protein
VQSGYGAATSSNRLRTCSADAPGCDVAVIVTQPGSKSQQNAQRQGLDLLYTRAVLVKHPLGRPTRAGRYPKAHARPCGHPVQGDR